MLHGLDGYWLERERFRTRLAVCLLAVSVLTVALALALMLDPRLREVFPDPERFGFEGPTQFVDRIRLEAAGPGQQSGESSVDFVTLESRRGGRPDRRAESGRPAPERDLTGEGLDEQDWNARARMMRLDAPIIRSEDLVALHLARPDYPEIALAMDLEGVVEVMAMIDTLGAVMQVQVFGGTRDSLFERAAIDAAFQNRYRPYLRNDTPQFVWVPLRYNFTIGHRP